MQVPYQQGLLYPESSPRVRASGHHLGKGLSFWVKVPTKVKPETILTWNSIQFLFSGASASTSWSPSRRVRFLWVLAFIALSFWSVFQLGTFFFGFLFWWAPHQFPPKKSSIWELSLVSIGLCQVLPCALNQGHKGRHCLSSSSLKQITFRKNPKQRGRRSGMGIPIGTTHLK